MHKTQRRLGAQRPRSAATPPRWCVGASTLAEGRSNPYRYHEHDPVSPTSEEPAT
ncbi:hypothetical protein BDZ97DRAFT_1858259, partial [Flammula alnicola]